MHVPMISIGSEVVDKPPGAGVILSIVHISLKMYYIPATLKKIKTYIQTYNLHIAFFFSLVTFSFLYPPN